LVRSTKPSPNRFAWIRETGFRFDKSIARNCEILTGVANQLRPNIVTKMEAYISDNSNRVFIH